MKIFAENLSESRIIFSVGFVLLHVPETARFVDREARHARRALEIASLPPPHL